MKVQRVGFFSDLPHGIPSEPSAASLSADHPQADEEKLLKYLGEGVSWIASAGIVRDVLANDSVAIGSPHILTDGVWAWPQDLKHYVGRYHVRLPSAFVAHAKKNGWSVPKDIQVDQLLLEP